jgi:hypothetical protein
MVPIPFCQVHTHNEAYLILISQATHLLISKSRRCKCLPAETEDSKRFVLRVFGNVDVCQRMLLSVGKTQLQQLLKVLQNKLRNGKLSGKQPVEKE